MGLILTQHHPSHVTLTGLQVSSLVVSYNLFKHLILAIWVVLQFKVITKESRQRLVEARNKARAI